MSTVPKAQDPAGLDDLRAEFPGWRIEAGPGEWRAVREPGPGGLLEVGAVSRAVLRALLDEADAVDCRHAIYALRDALRDLGLTARVFGPAVHTQTRAGILRVVTARRGRYTWTSGVPLAPIGDPQAAARLMLPGLGLA